MASFEQKNGRHWLRALVVGLLVSVVAIGALGTALPAWEEVKDHSRDLDSCDSAAASAKLGATGNYHVCTVAERSAFAQALVGARNRLKLSAWIGGVASLIAIVSFAFAFRGYRRRRAALAEVGLSRLTLR